MIDIKRTEGTSAVEINGTEVSIDAICGGEMPYYIFMEDEPFVREREIKSYKTFADADKALRAYVGALDSGNLIGLRAFESTL